MVVANEGFGPLYAILGNDVYESRYKFFLAVHIIGFIIAIIIFFVHVLSAQDSLGSAKIWNVLVSKGYMTASHTKHFVFARKVVFFKVCFVFPSHGIIALSLPTFLSAYFPIPFRVTLRRLRKSCTDVIVCCSPVQQPIPIGGITLMY
jgi:hypothetical protein